MIGGIVFGTWSLLLDSVNFSLNVVPLSIEGMKIADFLKVCLSIAEDHDFHIWGVSTTKTAMTAHFVRLDVSVDGNLIRHALEEMKEHFGIGDAILQVGHGRGAHPYRLHFLEVA